MNDWRATEESVSTQLLALLEKHARYATSMVADSAHGLLTRAIVAAVGVSIITLAAFAIAIAMANRIVRRLRSLRSGSLRLANETLPSIIQRLNRGEEVDVDAEAAVLDKGVDEIAQVAEAFTTAQRTAMAAASSEVRTRDGFNKVFLDIARRSQVLVRRQMDVLDVAQAKQNDPEHLEMLFQLDHLATRARRNAENLLILGGAQPGRRWQEPVAVEQIVRSAASETQDFARVSAIRLPDAKVHGNAVADLIHLLAELIDNATLFSPPEAPVSVHGNLVGHGLVIEVMDQGLGIRFEERERLNELLRNPPEFEEMTLAGHRHLGLFVVGRLAQRHSITVSLHQSAYGGINAIVLIPAAITDSVLSEGDSKPVAPVRPPGGVPVAQQVTETVPSMSGRDLPQLPPWPVPTLPAETGPDAGPPAATPVLTPSKRPRTPLPKRQRQTHLAPQLQLNGKPTDETAAESSSDRRPPLEIRRSMAAFQRGTRQARTNPSTEHENERAEREQ
jgi:hypothetical protein